MAGGGDPAQLPPSNGGEFLLSLLHKSQHPSQSQLQPTLTHQQQSLNIDPAVAAVGPTIPIAPPWSSSGRDHEPHQPPWPNVISPYLHNFPGFPQNPFPHPRVPGNQFSGNSVPVVNQGVFGDDRRRIEFSGFDGGGNRLDAFVQKENQQEQKLKFGSFPSDIQSLDILANANSVLNPKFNSSKVRELALGNGSYNGFDRNRKKDPKANTNSNLNLNAVRHANYGPHEQEERGSRWGKNHHSGNYQSMASPDTRGPPPGFQNQPKGRATWDFGNRMGLSHNEDRGANFRGLGDRNVSSTLEKGSVRRVSAGGSKIRGHVSHEMRLPEQLDHPGPPTGSNLPSVSASDFEESMLNSQNDITESGGRNKYLGLDKNRNEDDPQHGRGGGELDDLGEQLVDSLLVEGASEDKKKSRQHRSSREKDSRSDLRGQQLLSQRMRIYKRQMICRSDIDQLNAPFLAIYETLKPAEEEKAKQKQLLTLLETLVSKEWPTARLYLYGSCANSFGVSKSDIDVCLAIEEADVDKSKILLKLADILQADNLQNVQALTRARVPIVKLMDPVTGILCDICINNVLAVVNTKLLRDYAQIDERLRQLTFIVKHWAKSRGVNETYQGTLSSYAYVLMCIHFLQQRRPAILPCLQEMETTYSVTVDEVKCAYFDQVEKLGDFGRRNSETIAQLVWAFFNYWAYRHDYANAVISVRTGSLLSKQEKDWTRRIGNDRHLICIEDPFETSHDLGRVVDKYSIKVLREEFERAAHIMQYDPNPCVKLFECFHSRPT
ncbi:UTP:RNA uridylyltransferase 1-like [Quillaja saponaria]|uniref:RNA uridylyltransferase n=1 Tax=Quillaja saponaria TaxID=32244 RepID=A0AAD7LQ40_QUISA|nr:UTP:RNA uridylyltransferase 1-like [Quillaja saponaria]